MNLFSIQISTVPNYEGAEKEISSGSWPSRSSSRSKKPTSNSTKLLPVRSLPTGRSRRIVIKSQSSNSKMAKCTRSENPLTFMCEICADEKPTSDLFSNLGCKHSYSFKCIGKYVATKLGEKITKIKCPFSGCLELLDPHHCRSILFKKVFDKWGDALCESLILGSERFYCPFKDCSALLIDDMRVGNEVIEESECPYCNRLFCAQCKVPWHSGIACSEFQKLNVNERSHEDRMLMNLAETKKWQRCSKCHFFVERTQGCLSMTCRCGHTFCYHCGAALKDHDRTKCKR